MLALTVRLRPTRPLAILPTNAQTRRVLSLLFYLFLRFLRHVSRSTRFFHERKKPHGSQAPVFLNIADLIYSLYTSVNLSVSLKKQAKKHIEAQSDTQPLPLPFHFTPSCHSQSMTIISLLCQANVPTIRVSKWLFISSKEKNP